MTTKYLDSAGLSYFWGKIKTYVTNAIKVTGVKGNSESSYRTGNVNITAANVGAIAKNEAGNTQQLKRPASLQGANDVTLDAKINTLRANRLAFLPADQIIIEKTVDGGTTWTDAGVSDSTKTGLFSETRPSIDLPRIDGKKSPLCGIRVTITAMKYNVPSGTAETQKYNYWNNNYIKSTERYNQLKEMYFWVSVSGGSINVKVERARGNDPNNWSVIFNDTSFNMTGYSGNDYISFPQGVFGGGTTQTSNFWNYRITFMTDDVIPASPYDGSSQSIYEIRAYGDTWWTAGNEYAANDKIYTHDYLENVTFPNKITAVGGFVGDLTGIASNASKVNNHTVNKDVPSNAEFTDTTYESKSAASGGTAESLVTTGEKYTWNEKQSKLVSGTNIKTVNGNSLLGSGNISTGPAALTVTLTANGWTSNSQTVTVTGVTTTNNVIVSPDPSDMDDYSAAGIKCTAQAANSLTFTCETAPEAAIDVNVLIFS